MITVSTNFDGDGFKRKLMEAAERKIKEVIKRKLTFPGSEKLRIEVVNSDKEGELTIRLNGPDEIVAEAKRRWSED
jgi:hypothetical protein